MDIDLTNTSITPETINQLRQLYQRGNWEAAKNLSNEIVAVYPDRLDIINLLGTLSCQSGDLKQAIDYFQQTIKIQPNYVAGYVNLGIALHRQGDLVGAIAAYQKALIYEPHNAKTYLNLSLTYETQGELVKAITYLQMAIAVEPNYATAYFHLGNIFKQQLKLSDAIGYFQKAINLNPRYIEAHCNLAHTFLLMGNLRQGFAEYEWRTQHPQFTPRYYTYPLWDGSPLYNKTILLYTEQGFGDAIQFIRYAPLVQERGGRVILECESNLAKLFATVPGINQIFTIGETLPKFDLQAPLLSLPRIFQTTLETIPNFVPYLGEKIVNKYSDEANFFPHYLSSQPPICPLLKVGLVWATNRENPTSNKRSVSLSQFADLLNIPGVTYYSLQKDLLESDRNLLNTLPIIDLSPQLQDFADTAKAIERLDLIITVDTAVAHLAGALGKPVWVLLPWLPEWRWLLDGIATTAGYSCDSPWYPTMRLFRQSVARNWPLVLAEVKQELENCTAGILPLKLHPEGLGKNYSHTQILPVKSENLADQVQFNSHSQSTNYSLNKIQNLGICWPISPISGWGIYGLNLTLQLSQKLQIEPILFYQPSAAGLNPLYQVILRQIYQSSQEFQKLLEPHSETKIFCNFPILFPLGNNLETNDICEQINSDNNVGVIFFEDTKFSYKSLEKASKYQLIITGSYWNQKVLNSYGINHAKTVHQGIDTNIFHPASKPSLFTHRFVIFSGGKLEYRKGQDPVIAAFKQFYKRYPNALLLTSWHNFWPEYLQGLDQTGKAIGLPKVRPDKSLDIPSWLIANDIPPEAFIDIGLVPNYLVGQIIRHADVALFPNRCEGGTNLVAMECMACGIPTILSANTGHLDLIREDNCYVLNSHNLVKPTPLFKGVEGWGEVDVMEIVEVLEMAYYERGREKGEAAALFMQDWSWEKQIKKMVKAINDIL